MKAITIPQHGDASVLTYVEDFPTPKPGPGEVLIRVAVTGVNHVDLIVRRGYPGIPIPLPHIPGGDIAGTVEALGEGVHGVETGMRVVVYPLIACGSCQLCAEGHPNLCLQWQYFGLHRKGGYAEYTVVPAANLIPLPDSVTFEAAVTLPVAGLTAYHALTDVGGLKPGQTFFIWGGSGGLGTIAIQLAKHIGATVIATGRSEEKLEAMRALGADYVFNRTKDDIPAEVKKIAPAGVDLIMDYVGPATFPVSFEMLKKGGQMLLCGIITGRETNFSIHMTYLRHLSVKGLYLGTVAEMKALLELVADGTIRPVTRQRFPLRDAAKAQSLLETDGAIGKIILETR